MSRRKKGFAKLKVESYEDLALETPPSKSGGKNKALKKIRDLTLSFSNFTQLHKVDDITDVYEIGK